MAQQDPARAQELIETMLEWRHQTGVERVIRHFEFPERDAFLAAYPQGYHKVDKQVQMNRNGGWQAEGAQSGASVASTAKNPSGDA